MLASFSCYQCEERKLGCHSTCERYIQDKAVYEDKKRAYEASVNPIIYKGSFFGDDGQYKYRPDRK